MQSRTRRRRRGIERSEPLAEMMQVSQQEALAAGGNGNSSLFVSPLCFNAEPLLDQVPKLERLACEHSSVLLCTSAESAAESVTNAPHVSFALAVVVG